MIITSVEELDSPAFQSPEDMFAQERERGLFGVLLGLVKANCGEYADWDGSTICLDFVSGELTMQQVKKVVEAVRVRCVQVDIAVHTVAMGSGMWLLGLSSTIPIHLQAEAA